MKKSPTSSRPIFKKTCCTNSPLIGKQLRYKDCRWRLLRGILGRTFRWTFCPSLYPWLIVLANSYILKKWPKNYLVFIYVAMEMSVVKNGPSLFSGPSNEINRKPAVQFYVNQIILCKA